ncbi:MAG TPA: class I SAM-dependent methyltransferase [Methanocella sp.]|nr:class I SAM-dependent methyltransferase [Methanocella sp.]
MDANPIISPTGENFAEGGRPSKTAELIAMMRFRESRRPEDERICYDPYAVRFISPEVLDFIVREPEKYKALSEKVERSQPGHTNSIIARVRFIDDMVASSVRDGVRQVVILGAGYDTRAYRIEGVAQVRIFEVDHPNTQRLKKEKIREIFGSLPGHVTYVPLDLAVHNLGEQLRAAGYDPSVRSLFVMEGILVYLPPEAVDELLTFVANNSCRGSAIVFDYIPQSVVDGTCKLEAGKNMAKNVAAVGEPFRFGLKEGTLEEYLSKRGFIKIRNVTSEDYRRMYFHGKNADRLLNPLLFFAYAEAQ